MDYKKLVDVYEALGSTTKRLKKTAIIAELLKQTNADIQKLMLLLQGRVFPTWDQRELGVADRLLIKAIAASSGATSDKVEREFAKTGDLGLAAESLLRNRRQSTLTSRSLTITKVFDNIRKVAEFQGKGTVERKLQLISELLTTATAKEAKYIVRTISGNLRVGIGSGSIRDAIVWAFFGKELELKYDDKDEAIKVRDRADFGKYLDAVQSAYDLTNDFSVVAEAAQTKGLKGLSTISLKVGIPIKVMLAQKAKDVEDGFRQVGKPAAIEYKYDGFRIQLHKSKGTISLFTRRLENVTKQFPDVVKYAKEYIKGNEYILDSEAVGYSPKTRKYLPFQMVSQRIKRKYDISKLEQELPVEVNIFDVIYYEGKNYISTPFRERRKLVEKIVKSVPLKIKPCEHIESSNEEEAKKFLAKALDSGNEGVMLKALDAPYKPGSRVGYMLKLKPSFDTLDLVVIGADWGEGKRAKYLSSFYIACVDEDGNFKEIGKVASGIKELEDSAEGATMQQMTSLLKPLFTSEKGKTITVKPKVVIEVEYGEIQKSPTYSSGYALRFPRIKTVREDRKADDATTLNEIEKLYKEQNK
ncbi:ATP-dependent DNA ligase [Candidatus Woesearchaeota archaeon]|nr:ATP-dependent DNA ligase [Candidatus Woesearchaeota archaeon]